MRVRSDCTRNFGVQQLGERRWGYSNDYPRKKWTRRSEFKSWSRLFAFSMRKAWIHLFSPLIIDKLLGRECIFVLMQLPIKKEKTLNSSVSCLQKEFYKRPHDCGTRPFYDGSPCGTVIKNVWFHRYSSFRGTASSYLLASRKTSVAEQWLQLTSTKENAEIGIAEWGKLSTENNARNWSLTIPANRIEHQGPLWRKKIRRSRSLSPQHGQKSGRHRNTKREKYPPKSWEY